MSDIGRPLPGRKELRRAAEVSHDLGLRLDEKGDFASAEECLTTAVSLDPGYWEAWYHLGMLSRKLRNLQKAQDCFLTALRIHPTSAEACLAMGIVLQESRGAADALPYYQKAIKIDKALVQAHYNLGTAFKETGQFADAATAFRTATRYAPDHGNAHWNLALMLLLTGNFLEGWSEFGWRFRKSGAAPRPVLPAPLWDGSSLPGLPVLLFAEQGCGDTIQFIRYAPLVAERVGAVEVECQAKGLKRLLQGVKGVARVVERGEPLPICAACISLMELPALFSTTLDTVPAAIPYIDPDTRLVEDWKERFRPETSMKVGLVWAGNKAHENDRNRSIPPELLGMLGGIPGIAFYSLQVGESSVRDRGVPPGLERMTDFAPHIGDFADTAACVVNLDLVITVDTAVAHLAGALGVPVWTMLPFVPDWRWLMDREDSPWYPTMRLFRQERQGEWAPVLRKIAAGLAQAAISKN